jgi:hypothetical protein
LTARRPQNCAPRDGRPSVAARLKDTHEGAPRGGGALGGAAQIADTVTMGAIYPFDCDARAALATARGCRFSAAPRSQSTLPTSRQLPGC